MTMPDDSTLYDDALTGDQDNDRYVMLAHIVGSDVENVSPAYGSCMTWQIPQSGVSQPVQILTRRTKRTQAKLAIYSLGLNASSQTAFGSVTDPGAFGAIAFTPSLPAGTYTVQATGYLSGTVQAGDANNFRITTPSIPNIATIPVPAVANTPVTITATVQLAVAGSIGIQAPVAGSNAAVVYNGAIIVTPTGTTATVILNSNPDRLNPSTLQGYTVAGVGRIPDWESMQPLYAICVGGTAAISVIDESYGEAAQ